MREGMRLLLQGVLALAALAAVVAGCLAVADRAPNGVLPEGEEVPRLVVANVFYGQSQAGQRDTYLAACRVAGLVLLAESNHVQPPAECPHRWVGEHVKIGFDPARWVEVDRMHRDCSTLEGLQCRLIGVVLADRLTPNDPALVLVGTHLVSKAWTDYPKRRPLWRTQWKQLGDFTATLARGLRGVPVIVAGDLNDPRPEPLSMRRLGMGLLTEAPTSPTFPAHDPDRRLDRVLTRGLEVCEEGTLRTGSDHLALVLALRCEA